MNKYAALFGGQGSQYPGMAKALYDNSPRVRELYQMGSDLIGWDLMKMSFEGDEAEMARTGISQPVVYTHSLAAWTVARDRLPEPGAVAGHSLGEYAALCVSGAFSLEDGFRIIRVRAQAMEHAAQTARGIMIAVMGVDAATVERVCEETPGGVWAVNYNQPTQTVISGEEGPCAAAGDALVALGAKATRLSVGSAYHSPLMEPAAQELREGIGSIAFGPIKYDFYSNTTGERLVIENYVDYFVNHMLSPVRYTNQVEAMVRDGVDCCVEFGPKKTASTLARKTARSLKVANVEDPQSLEKAAALFA